MCSAATCLGTTQIGCFVSSAVILLYVCVTNFANDVRSVALAVVDPWARCRCSTSTVASCIHESHAVTRRENQLEQPRLNACTYVVMAVLSLMCFCLVALCRFCRPCISVRVRDFVAARILVSHKDCDACGQCFLLLALGNLLVIVQQTMNSTADMYLQWGGQRQHRLQGPLRN